MSPRTTPPDDRGDDPGVIAERARESLEADRRAELRSCDRLLAGLIERMVHERTTELRQANDALRREVAQRAWAVEALRLGEERFRGAFDVATIGMALVAPDGRW